MTEKTNVATKVRSGQSEEQRNDLSMTDQSQNMSLDISAPNAGLGRMWTTLPNNGDRETAVKLNQAMGEAESLAACVGQVLEIENILLHDVIVINDAGEEVPCVRTVLMAKDGKTYASVSNGAISSMQLIMTLCGVGPWTPPLKVTPLEVRTRRGYRTLRLQLV